MDGNGGRNTVKIEFPKDSPPSDPQSRPVLIVGQLPNLNRITFQDVKHKLEPRVTEEVYNLALSSLHPSKSDSVSLHLGLATLAALPGKCSRHNAPSRPHALTSIVKSTTSGADETIVIVCEYDDVIASAAAVARAYPLYSRKTGSGGCSAPTTGRQDDAVKEEEPPSSSVVVRVEFILVEPPQLRPGPISSDALSAIADAVRRTARIVDTPCSEMNVGHFLKEVRDVATECGLSLKVIEGEELKAKGLNGIYGVGKAAEVGPALAVLSHMGGGSAPRGAPVVAWVGKGIVYDTGGLSIKGKLMMPGMKRDCGGAAAILGAMMVAAKLGLALELHAVFCLAENAVGPRATRPDDIHTLYSGRTVEINNTDAEGRLVLADGVVYAGRDLGATVILDMATLTGAQGVATGKYHGAVLTNSEEWETKAVRAGRVSGDLLFPIPFCPELHFPEFNSAVADMKNSVGDRANAQSSCAGLFILAHLGFDFPGSWIHVDMASPVHSGERATGYGVTLLTLLFGEYSADEMIKKASARVADTGCPVDGGPLKTRNQTDEEKKG